ncbi:hypothetical protein HGRIS_013536 [Hohenbuehelia grisea]|uniref:Uncharacterized protein n=1 Tax=Hohenbuehelia grisea TaxID=104357 RepID=A0ABR3IW05_9AGAR
MTLRGHDSEVLSMSNLMEELGFANRLAELVSLLATLRSLGRSIFGSNTNLTKDTSDVLWKEFFRHAAIVFPGAEDPEKTTLIKRYIKKTTRQRFSDRKRYCERKPMARDLQAEGNQAEKLREDNGIPSGSISSPGPDTSLINPILALPLPGSNAQSLSSSLDAGQSQEAFSFEECALREDTLTTCALPSTDPELRKTFYFPRASTLRSTRCLFPSPTTGVSVPANFYGDRVAFQP